MYDASLSGFKKWLSENSSENLAEFFDISKEGEEAKSLSEKYEGREVRTKVSRQKLLDRIETEANVDDVVEEFIQDGGVISGVEGKKFLVETENYEFSVPRVCVKHRKKQPGQ